MKNEEVLAFLQAGTGSIAFDNNALFSPRRFYNICDQINQANEYQGSQLKIVVPALVHAEKLHDLRQDLGNAFLLKQIQASLAAKQVIIMPFEQHHAEAAAQLFAQQFPKKVDWMNYKRKRCCACLSISNCDETLEKVGKDKQCSATLDWLIAAYAYAENCLLITDDRGVEFEQIPLKTGLQALEIMLKQLENRHQ